MYVAISDLHGECNKLKSMMAQLHNAGVDFYEDTLIFLGDYVDGGLQTKELVSELIRFSREFPHWVFLMGNHEDMMLSGLGYCESVCKPHYRASFTNWYYQGGEATARSYLQSEKIVPYPELILSQIPQNHLEWLRDRPLYHETEDFIFVHAGLDAYAPNERDAKTLLWTRDWFYKYKGKPVIYGHTCSVNYEPVLHPEDNPTSIGIDTMHHGHGYVTAVLLDTSKEPWYTFIRV